MAVGRRRFEPLYGFPAMKIVEIQQETSFPLRREFGVDILVLLLLTSGEELGSFERLSKTLNDMRQVRILICGLLRVGESENLFKENVLKLCQFYKMTNVLMKLFLLENEDGGEISPDYYELKPYPTYGWFEKNLLLNHGIFYPQHWRNLQNITLITCTSQITPGNLVFEDENGGIHINGLTARLILLFAEKFNATLKMLKPLKVGEIIHYGLINEWTFQNKLDIGMVLASGDGETYMRYLSDSYDMTHVMLMLPCSGKLNLLEVFGILLNLTFFACLFICTYLLSLVQYLVDYIFDGVQNHLELLLNLKIFPSILSQSYDLKPSKWKGLNIIYFLAFVAGLNISVQFSAEMNTFFTSPPQKHQISTFEELSRQSALKILLDARDVAEYREWLPTIGKAYISSANSTFVVEKRNSLDTTYGYLVTHNRWHFVEQQQNYFSHKLFCTNEQLFLPKPPFSIALQENSPYREALNYLIHRVHERGLYIPWYSSTFVDMVKLKMIALNDLNPEERLKVLTAKDLFWLWMILFIGLGLSVVVFICELYWENRNRMEIISK
uniref:Ionotropic glutamate receptor C-terminal domain-containing protein n=1 Tax=Musca domestica TaxID=7370 RepID=A0A1I8MI58_MUSDO